MNEKARESGGMRMGKEWEPVELLRHSRHDWLNHIQLIKANLSLNRIGRVNEIIEEITARSRHESKLTNLHIPRVAEMLLTFNWNMHFYRLEAEVIGKECDLSEHEQNLLVFLSALFERLDRHADIGTDNRVLVSFRFNDDAPLLTIDYSGRLNHAEELRNGSFLHKPLKLIEHYANEEEFVLTVSIT
jgi:stage 0 sporulation protein B (sporulation initiation phosphotransferase)